MFKGCNVSLVCQLVDLIGRKGGIKYFKHINYFYWFTNIKCSIYTLHIQMCYLTYLCSLNMQYGNVLLALPQLSWFFLYKNWESPHFLWYDLYKVLLLNEKLFQKRFSRLPYFLQLLSQIFHFFSKERIEKKCSREPPTPIFCTFPPCRIQSKVCVKLYCYQIWTTTKIRYEFQRGLRLQ